MSTAVVAQCIVINIHTAPAYIHWQYRILDEDVYPLLLFLQGDCMSCFGAPALLELREKDSVVEGAVLVCDFQQAQSTSWLLSLL